MKVCKERKKEREKTKNFRAQFYPTEMSRSAGVLFFLLLFFSLFLSFSLFFSCSLSETPSPFIYFMHSPKMPDQPPFKNSWMVADLDNCVSACNKCKESVFLGWLKMLKVCKERKREKERKLKILEHNFIQLECPGVLVFFSLFLFFSPFLLFALKNTLSLQLFHALTQLSRSATCHLSKTVGMQLQLTQKRAGLGWENKINVGRVCFWEKNREKERKRENKTPALLNISVQKNCALKNFWAGLKCCRYATTLTQYKYQIFPRSNSQIQNDMQYINKHCAPIFCFKIPKKGKIHISF